MVFRAVLPTLEYTAYGSDFQRYCPWCQARLLYPFLRQGVALLMRLLMDVEVQALIGAERYQRSKERTTQRGDTRPSSHPP